MYDKQGRDLYAEHLSDARVALRAFMVVGWLTIIGGVMGVCLAVALTGGV